jgi:hypothetical protein
MAQRRPEPLLELNKAGEPVLGPTGPAQPSHGAAGAEAGAGRPELLSLARTASGRVVDNRPSQVNAPAASSVPSFMPRVVGGDADWSYAMTQAIKQAQDFGRQYATVFTEVTRRSPFEVRRLASACSS